jgi:hypothetical protein
MAEECDQSLIKLNEVPTGRVVSLDGLRNSVVRILGRASFGNNYIAVDTRRLCDDEPIVMDFPGDGLCRLLTREDIEAMQLPLVEGTDLYTR